MDASQAGLRKVAEISTTARNASMSDYRNRINETIINQLGVSSDKITTDASFIDDLGADSLDTVELVMSFEDEFGVEIPDQDAETIVTVGDAYDLVAKKIGAE